MLDVVGTPSIFLEKLGTWNDDGNGVAEVGETITYTFDVNNNGDVPLDDITLIENSFDLAPPGLSPVLDSSSDVGDDGILSVDETWTYNATHTLDQDDIDYIATDLNINNQATAYGNPPGGIEGDTSDDVFSTDTAVVQFLSGAILAELAILKDGVYEDVGSDGLNPGDKLNYTFQVTNTGNVTVTGVVINEVQFDLPGPIVITPPSDIDLSPGEMQEWTGSYTLTQADIDAIGVDNTIDNIGSATGIAPDGGYVDSNQDPAQIILIPVAAIDIEKSTNGQDADEPEDPFIIEGNTVNWEYNISNTGQVTLTDVILDDDMLGAITLTGLTDEDDDGNEDDLAVGSTASGSATGTAEFGQYSNLGTATGTDPNDSLVSDVDPSQYFGVSGAGLIAPTGTTALDYIDGTAQSFEDYYAGPDHYGDIIYTES